MSVSAEPVDLQMQEAQRVLAQVWGFRQFRPQQDDVIRNVLAKQDSLVVMPTGGGKSLTFQLPALVMPGVTLVVSPLIALMMDQVAALRQNGVAAACLTTGQPDAEQREIAAQLQNKTLKLLYVAPERLLHPKFLTYVQQLNVSLVAIDEAHCVSTWGPDFRPEYAQLGVLRGLLPGVPFLAATATADELTRQDILQKLEMPAAKVFISSFDRPNLSLNVIPADGRFRQLTDFISAQGRNAPGLVYCLSRKSTDEVFGKLKDQGLRVGRYHAGLDHTERNETQAAFLADRVQIVVATIAFGMGIDKSNIRWVAHYNLPGNIEAYYQEIGRAGRDGLPAETLLIYSFADVKTRHIMYNDAAPEHREVLFQKLDRLWQLCETPFCRRQVLLQYFGETMPQPCGNCDVCRNPRKLIEGTIPAQKILSTVARAGNSLTANDIADVLRGSQAASITSRGLQQLTTHGIGKEWSHWEWTAFANQLVLKGLAGFDYEKSGAITLTEASRAVLKGQLKVDLYPPVTLEEKQKAKTKVAPGALNLLETELMDKLRTVRTKLAQEGNVPPYIVFSDASLEAMAHQKPITLEAFTAVEGVGAAKLDKYGDVFTQTIYNFLSAKGELAQGSTHSSAPPPKPRERRVDITTTVLETERLLNEGRSLDEISEIRSISTSAIAEHITRLMEHGRNIDVWKYITEDEVKAVHRHLAVYTAEKRLKPLFDTLEGKLTYGQIRLALAWLTRQGVTL